MMRRIRLGTSLLLLVIAAQGIALFVLGRRSADREAHLRAALALYRDRAQEVIVEKLEQPFDANVVAGMTLEDAIRLIKSRTRDPALPNGLLFYVDPVGLQEAGANMSSPVPAIPPGAPLGETLRALLRPLGLGYQVSAGLVTITARESLLRPLESEPYYLHRDYLR